MTARYPRTTPMQLALARNRACREGREWVGSRDVQAVWAECPRGDWMLVLMVYANVSPGMVFALTTRFACWLESEPTQEAITTDLLALDSEARAALLLQLARACRRLVSMEDVARGLHLEIT